MISLTRNDEYDESSVEFFRSRPGLNGELSVEKVRCSPLPSPHQVRLSFPSLPLTKSVSLPPLLSPHQVRLSPPSPHHVRLSPPSLPFTKSVSLPPLFPSPSPSFFPSPLTKSVSVLFPSLSKPVSLREPGLNTNLQSLPFLAVFYHFPECSARIFLFPLCGPVMVIRRLNCSNCSYCNFSIKSSGGLIAVTEKLW